MKKLIIIPLVVILLYASFFSGCVEEENGEETVVGMGTLRLQITDKPSELDIIYANVTISMVHVHKAAAGDIEDDENDAEDDNGENEEYENKDENDDGFIADGNGPYSGEIGEDILFIGNATGGDKPYNWSWDFGDGDNSYDQNATHNYSAEGEYMVNLTVTDNNGSGVIDWYITTAIIGDDDDEEENGNGNAGWYTIVNESKTFDLIALQNVTDILGEKNLSAGKYTQIRLTVEKAEITINNSGELEVHDLKIPSGNVKLTKGFWIYEDETTVLTLDFDIYKSVHKTGSNKYMMKPTIKIIQE